MSAIEFEPWPKIPRLNRDIIISEKLDGTNAAILIVEHVGDEVIAADVLGGNLIALVIEPGVRHAVYAQSRNKFITPGKSTDNYGFAGWVQKNAEALVELLGEGRHFGEWWGAGIQCGYGLTGGDKRFSLFNAGRWGAPSVREALRLAIPELGVVPVIYEGPFDGGVIDGAIARLRLGGSFAAAFDKPEGIVVYHTALRSSFKVTLESDEKPKAQPRRQHDLLPETIGTAV